MYGNANRVGEAPLGAIEDAVSSMTTLNKAASEISHAFDIHACTDVTGFSFLGHLSEMLNDDITALIDSISIRSLPEHCDAQMSFSSRQRPSATETM